jgi:hypothetical protein
MSYKKDNIELRDEIRRLQFLLEKALSQLVKKQKQLNKLLKAKNDDKD